jgi:ornithine cyclodeaminase/alanine dehydrogenase-like protein (mu-crystallin family)
MRIRALDAQTIRGLVSYEELIPLMRSTLAAVSRGEAELPLRWALQLPNEAGMLVMMPGYLGPEASAGIKLVSLVPNAAMNGRSSHLGVVMLYDADALRLDRHGAANGSDNSLRDRCARTGRRSDSGDTRERRTS